MRKNCPAILKKTKKRQVLKVGRMSGLFRRARKGEEWRGRARKGEEGREEKKRQVFKNRSEICTYVISKIDTERRTYFEGQRRRRGRAQGRTWRSYRR